MKILLLLMFCTVLPMQAQQMKKLTDLKDFEARLLQEAKNIESIESNFTQIKYLDVFDEKITSKGKFYYKKSNKICMDYAQPMNYLIVINNNQLKIVSDGKKSIMDLHSEDFPVVEKGTKMQSRKDSVSFDKVKARYIKIIAEVTPKLPAWHSMPGEKAFLFVDEIGVE